jgi:aromatic-L-amino-acid decarboxylase
MKEQTEDDGSGSRGLDPGGDAMRRIGYDFVDRMVDELTSLRDERVVTVASREKLCQDVDACLPEDSTDLAECMDDFFRRVAPGMTRVNHPRFHAYIPGPSSFAGSVGMMIAAATNPFVGTWLGGATLSALEVTVIRWIAEMLGYDPSTAGLFTSGGSMANLTALAAARTRWVDRSRKPSIYVSSEGHASMVRAAAVLGFEEDAIRTVSVDSGFRMDVDSLGEAIRRDQEAGRFPLCVAANAGTTNLGVVDPLPEIAGTCQENHVWFHVDAAYGGFAALTDFGRQRLQGMEKADSLTLDPHKWLYCPMGIGCVLVRDEPALRRAFVTSGDYLRDLPKDDVNFFEYGPELSRPARVLPVWMVIRSAGRAKLARQIDEDMRLARMAAEMLAEDERLEVISPELSVVAFRHLPRPGEAESDRAARDVQLMNSILASGDLMLSTTIVGGRTTLRMVVMNHRTTEADIRYSVSRIRLHAV